MDEWTKEDLERAYEITERKIELYKKLYPNNKTYKNNKYFFLVFEDVLKQILLEKETESYMYKSNTDYFKQNISI